MNPKWSLLLILFLLALIRGADPTWFRRWLVGEGESTGGLGFSGSLRISLIFGLLGFGGFTYSELLQSSLWWTWFIPAGIYVSRSIFSLLVTVLLTDRRLRLLSWLQNLPLASSVKSYLIAAIVLVIASFTEPYHELNPALLALLAHVVSLFIFGLYAFHSVTIPPPLLRVTAILYLCALETVPLIIAAKEYSFHV